ncbi:MAG TPA: molybdopterin cofactor-binding domain-containing protein [Acetobacteraceae bacterium]|jgi:CO/xanthine dehydrogenase Mo-binding subunit|nr:molybdopterin cofactor-binding domain-containing protein [Acetobacteraceae bacterium]
MSDTLPLSIQTNRRLEKWIRFDPDRTVHLAVGKVELGQGNVTALAQIAAEELDVDLNRIAVLSGDTQDAPDEGQTTSSQSIEVSGRSVRLVSAELRARVLDRLAQRLNCSPAELTVEDGVIRRGDAPTGHDYWNFSAAEDFARDIEGTATPKPHTAYRVVGRPVPRRDLPAKVSGAAFIHDMVRPDMLHARILRQPNRGARLVSFDEAAVRRAERGEFRVVRVGDFVAFVGPDETVVQRAATAAPLHAKWDNVRQITTDQQEAAWLVGQPSNDRMLGTEIPEPRTHLVEASYSRPYIAHASMAPSCALAEYRSGHLSVWSHTQGPYPLRASLANVLGIAPDVITVRHAHGAGCYGHNGADDVAVDAAVIAMQVPDRCIRVQWRREEEFGFEPLGPAMHVTLRAALDDAGKPVDWTADIWSATHVQRPSTGGNMLTHDALPTPPPDPRPTDPPEANGGGGTRNAFALYDFPVKRVIHHLVLRPPVRTSALRGLGALPNVFAIECFMDELAERAGVDPVEYRLSMLSDPRARRLLENLAQRCNWSARGPAGSGRGLGLGWAKYKNKAAYAAVAVEVEVDQEVRLLRAWCTADAGLVINPDGGRNQLEGGIVQAASMTLKEQVRLEGDGVASLDWSNYPILRFSEVPEISTEIIDAPDQPTLGMGECTFGPTAAAIGNAVAHALGARIRDMPFTRERIAAVLLK